MKKDAFVLSFTGFILLAAFIVQVRGQWAGLPSPGGRQSPKKNGGKRENFFGKDAEVSTRLKYIRVFNFYPRKSS